MLLMRLGDALRQLALFDGAQTHRSWWVAKSAVTDVKRGAGRAALTLANGIEAPVSRRFSGHLRSRGWY
jgi:DNA-binding LytR/AlgR family response regulator